MAGSTSSAIPPEVRDRALARLDKLIAVRAPVSEHEHHRLEVTTRGAALTLVEHHAPWQPGGDWTACPVAQFRFDTASGTWSLHWPRSSGRWERYDDVAPSPDLALLVAKVNEDPDGVFWG